VVSSDEIKAKNTIQSPWKKQGKDKTKKSRKLMVKNSEGLSEDREGGANLQFQNVGGKT